MLSHEVRDEWYPSPSVIDCTETESNLEWRELMELHAMGADIDPLRLKAALLHGVPPALRPQAWLAFSGCTEWMRRHPKVYDQLCARIEQGGSGAPAASVQDQIEKDLRRTEAGTSGAKLEALRRVLQAFASFNPAIGYVQGMNFIAAGLLRVLPEPAAFWMLVLIEQAHHREGSTPSPLPPRPTCTQWLIPIAIAPHAACQALGPRIYCWRSSCACARILTGVPSRALWRVDDGQPCRLPRARKVDVGAPPKAR